MTSPGSKGSGGANLRSPTGGLAKGIVGNLEYVTLEPVLGSWVFTLSPSTKPEDVLTLMAFIVEQQLEPKIKINVSSNMITGLFDQDYY